MKELGVTLGLPQAIAIMKGKTMTNGSQEIRDFAAKLTDGVSGILSCAIGDGVEVEIMVTRYRSQAIYSIKDKDGVIISAGSETIR